MQSRKQDGSEKPLTPRAHGQRNSASRLFGYDVFVSFPLGPPPRGAYSYASNLARRLRERDFTVFFSEDDAPPGEHLDRALVTALRRSRILVVIVNRSVLERPGWIRKEVEEFTRCNPSGPVIPISVDDTLTDTVIADEMNLWLQCRGRIWLNESQAALENGTVGEEVLERLAIAPVHVKSSIKWRWTVWAVVAVLVGATATALVQRAAAERNAARAVAGESRARAELVRAVALRLASNAETILTGTMSARDDQAILQVLAAHRLHPGPEVDDALANVFNQRRRVLKLSTSDGFKTVAVSPDARWLVSVDSSNVIQRWDARTLRPVGKPIRETRVAITAVAFSGDGAKFVTVGAKKTVQIWSTEDGSALGPPIVGEGQTLTKVDFSPDGRMVVASAGDGIWLFDAMASRPLGALVQADVSIEAVAFSSDGRLVVAADATSGLRGGRLDGTLILWNVATRRLVALARHSGRVHSLAFSPDSRRIVSGGIEGRLRLWDAYLRPLGPTGQAGSGTLMRLAFNADGTRILSGSFDGMVRLWSGTTAQPLGEPWEGHRRWVSGVAFTEDGSRAVSASADGGFRVWNSATEVQDHLRFLGHATGVTTVACCANGHVVSGGGDGTVRLWDVATGQAIGHPFTADHGIHRLAIANGEQIVSVDNYHGIRRWSLDGQLIARTSTDFSGILEDVAFSAGASLLALAGEDRRVRIWRAQEGRLVSELALQGTSDDSTVLALTRQGDRVAIAGWDRPLSIWNIDTGRVTELQSTGKFDSLAFSNDGKRLAAGESFGVRLWDLGVEPPMSHDLVTGHSSVVSGGIAFSADGRYLVSGSVDRTVRIWNADSGQPLRSRLWHDDALAAVAISDDGRYVVAGSNDGTVTVWPGPTAWIEELCTKLTVNMSHRQWNEWVSSEIAYAKQCPDLPIPPDSPATATPSTSH